MPYLLAAKRSKDKTIDKYKPKVKKFFTEQTGRILERYNEFFNLPKLAGEAEIPLSQIDPLIEYIMPNIENDMLKKASKPLHTSGLQKSIDDVNNIADTAVSSSIANAQVSQGIVGLGNKITRVNITTKSILRDIVAQGIEDGSNIYTIANNIQDSGLDEFYKGRSLAVARTETRLAYDYGGKIAYKELGVEKFDVVGCVGTLAGANDFGYTASYGDFSESIGSCGVIEMPMNIWDPVSGSHHINHAGVQVASIIPI